MTKKNIMAVVLVSMCVLLISLMCLIAYYYYLLNINLIPENKNGVLHQIVVNEGVYQLIWERRDINIVKGYDYLLATSDESLVVAGKVSLQQYDALHIVGETHVQLSKLVCPSSVYVYDDVIFIGNCLSEIMALDIAGNQIWKITLQNEGNITRLAATENLLYAYTEVGNIYRISSTGTDKTNLDFDCPNVLIAPAAVYSKCDGGLSKYISSSKLPAWRIYINEPIYGLPLAQGDYVIVTTNLGDKNVLVLDDMTGNTIWRTSERNVVSNVVLQKDILFYLTKNGELIGRSVGSGDIKIKIRLTSTIEDTQLFATSHHYLLANDKVIFIYTGDSSQLFAIEVTQ